MLRLRYAIANALLGISMILPLGVAQAGDQPFQRLLPLLVDLSGWEGEKADGMSMQMSDAGMTTATRDYKHGSAQVHALVMIGPAATGALAPLQTGMSVKTAEEHVITSNLHGMAVLKNYNYTQKSGTLIVALSKEAMFNFSYEGITEDEALALAEKFDWKALQAATQTK